MLPLDSQMPLGTLHICTRGTIPFSVKLRHYLNWKPEYFSLEMKYNFIQSSVKYMQPVHRTKADKIIHNAWKLLALRKGSGKNIFWLNVWIFWNIYFQCVYSKPTFFLWYWAHLECFVFIYIYTHKQFTF